MMTVVLCQNGSFTEKHGMTNPVSMFIIDKGSDRFMFRRTFEMFLESAKEQALDKRGKDLLVRFNRFADSAHRNMDDPGMEAT